MKENSKKSNTGIYILMVIMYILGVIADGIGHINWLINICGVALEVISMYFIIEYFDVLYTYDMVKPIKLAIINLSCIIGGILAISILWNFKMIMFFISMGIFIISNIVILILVLYNFSDNERKKLEIERQKIMYNSENNDEEDNSNISIIIN